MDAHRVSPTFLSDCSRIARPFYRLAIVNTASNITIPLSGAISLSFLGHLETSVALAAVAIVIPLFNGIYFVFGFLRMVTNGSTAQSAGSNDQELIILIALRNGAIGLLLGLLLLLLQAPLAYFWFHHVMDAAPEIKASGIDYFSIRIWAAPAVLLNSVLVGWLLGRERSDFVLAISILGNAIIVALDYLFVAQYHWASAGAGIAQSIGQYLTLVLSLLLAIQGISWQSLQNALKQFWDIPALQSVFNLNKDFFIRSLSNATVAAMFVSFSTALGTATLVENTLILQIYNLVSFCFDGIGFATETLAGKLKCQGDQHSLIALAQVSVVSNLGIGLAAAGICSCFPQVSFGWLTNNAEALATLKHHVIWLFLILGSFSMTASLDGYFAGLTQGKVLRNSSVIGSLLGFFPVALMAVHSHNNHGLLLALGLFMSAKLLVLAIYLFQSDEMDFYVSWRQALKKTSEKAQAAKS